MSSTFSIALSALKAQSEAIDITGNNLANLNTTGFKESEVNFEDMISQSMGGTQIGMGVAPPTAEQDFTQGALASSTSPLAVAIQGNGFFVVNSPGGQQLYTRDGDFTIDSNGVLQTQTGETVQGWMASASGAINATGAPTNIVLPPNTMLPPQATTSMSISANLDLNPPSAGAANVFSTPVQVVDSLGNTHTLSATFTQQAGNTWSYEVSVPGADMANANTGFTGNTTNLNAAGATYLTGGSQTFTFNVVGSATPVTATVNGGAGGINAATALTDLNNQLNSSGITASINAATGQLQFSSASAFTVNDGAATAGTGLTNEPGANQTSTSANLLTSGTVTFGSNGLISGATQTVAGASNNITAANPIAVNLAGLADGASAMNISWSLYGSNGSGTLTQYAQASGLNSSSQNGSQASQLSGFSIQNGGQVVATFSNGATRVEAQLAVASIENPGSLTNAGDNAFATTGSTANPAIGMPQTGSRGQIVAGSLETSNADLATEFSNLIVYQSGYQAASKVISTANQMDEDLLNLIH